MGRSCLVAAEGLVGKTGQVVPGVAQGSRTHEGAGPEPAVGWRTEGPGEVVGCHQAPSPCE